MAHSRPAATPGPLQSEPVSNCTSLGLKPFGFTIDLTSARLSFDGENRVPKAFAREFVRFLGTAIKNSPNDLALAVFHASDAQRHIACLARGQFDHPAPDVRSAGRERDSTESPERVK